MALLLKVSDRTSSLTQLPLSPTPDVALAHSLGLLGLAVIAHQRIMGAEERR